MRSVITTASGTPVDYDDIATVQQVSMEDIATALSNSARFAGHTSRFHSVAAHAVAVYRLLADADMDADVCFAGLHHDDHEAFLTDIPTPLKHRLEREAPGVYRGMVGAFDAEIARGLGIPRDLLHHPAVVQADQIALALEAHVLKPNSQIAIGAPLDEASLRTADRYVEDLGHDDARNTFLAIHYELAPAAAGMRR